MNRSANTQYHDAFVARQVDDDRAPSSRSGPPKADGLALAVYGVGPIALVVLLILRHFGLVASAPLWAYVAAIASTTISSRLVERWRDAQPGSIRLHARVFVHVAGVTLVIYLSGWGPALGMAYAFSAFAELEQSGAKAWRAALGWSLVGCAVGQVAVFAGWAPSFLTRSHAGTIGFLGAFVLGIAIQMAGATGERRERAEALLAHQALHDPLTGLPTRQVLVDRLTHAIEMRKRRGGDAPVVMFLDLDRFKLVNDTFGHQAGDELLSQVADRLTAVLRVTDTLSRFGGDEFVILCEHPGDSARVAQIIERTRAVFDEPFPLGTEELHISVSVGVARVDDDVTSTEQLLSEADAAMYIVKSQDATGKVQLFDEPTRRAARHRLHTETDLAHAVERDELRLHYQPIVEISTRRMVGVEALLRWQHPERGLLGPSEFLDAAERTGLIVPIDEWVLTNACATVTKWNRSQPRDLQLHLSVNLSPHRLAEPNFVEKITALLANAHIDPAELRLSFELTETFVAVSAVPEHRHLTELHDLGITLAIDDFGTGYSSLAYVKDLPVSVVKIGRNFIEGLCRKPRDHAIVRGIIELAHSVDLHVVAKGVETEEQYEALAALSCDYAQGFVLGRPQPPEVLFTHTIIPTANTSQRTTSRL